MIDNNWYIDLAIARNRDLADYLQSRPHDEELGESLDLYEKQLREEGKLTEKAKKDIRSIHLQYISSLKDSDLAIKTVSDVYTEEDDLLQGFCEDQVVLYKTTLEESHIRSFADAYKAVESPYVTYHMAKILLRYHVMDKSMEYYKKSLRSSLYSLERFWNNKEAVYACTELLFDVVSSEHFNRTNCSDALLGKMLEYAYLLLSRVVLWPEDTDGRFEEFDVPITYRHKISSLNKRAEILLKHKDYFEELVPSYSTSETLSVADYSLAHDYAFMGNHIGTKSLFKRDAGFLYDTLSGNGGIPFSTAIRDAKNDSFELAYRFYLKYKKGDYQITSDEYELVFDLLGEIVSEKHEPINKVDEKQIRQYLSDNGIEYFYHFTERENIENIKRNGGICSLKYCLIHAIEVSTKGDMTLLRDTDAYYRLEDYARLSFCERHPLIKKRQAAGADLVLLKIKIDVAWRYDTLFADRDAAKQHHHGGTIDDLKLVRMDAVHKRNLDEWDPDYDYNQAEVMVKSIVPIEYIVNIDDPIDLSPPKISSPEDDEITKEKLIRAITTLAYLSDLFKNSSFLLAAGDGRNEKKRVTMYSFAGILGYQFEEIYHFEDYSSLVDMPMQQHYDKIIANLADSDDDTMDIADLSNNWSDILQTILEIQTANVEESKTFINLQPEIDNITDVIEVLSGSKCRKPTIGYITISDPQRTQFGRDAFTEMVENAVYNPFEITAEPTLQNFPPLPDLHNTFKAELLNLYKTTDLKELGHIEIFILYVYRLVKSYYEIAGRVPKNTVDAMIEQCHKAIKETLYGWYIPTLDEMKYKIYSTLFSGYKDQ